MNITILANKDLASCVAINYLVEGLGAHKVSVFLSSRVGSKPLAEPLQQLKMVEQQWPNEILFPLLARVGNSTAELKGFDQLAETFDGRLAILNNINEEQGCSEFAKSEPDLVLSIRYGVILRDPVLAIPTHGVLNLHSGLLPDYKGVMATFWALLHGESTIGTTLHYIDDKSIDTGRIVTRTELTVQSDRSYFWHVLELYHAGCQSMLDAVHAIDNRAEISAHQQDMSGSYFSFPSLEDIERFHAAGWRLYDTEDVVAINRRFLP